VRGCRKHVRHMWHMWLSNCIIINVGVLANNMWLSNCIIINVGVLANNHKGTLMSGLSSSLYCLDSLYLVRTHPPYLLEVRLLVCFVSKFTLSAWPLIYSDKFMHSAVALFFLHKFYSLRSIINVGVLVLI
jgi:hypothetical protein